MPWARTPVPRRRNKEAMGRWNLYLSQQMPWRIVYETQIALALFCILGLLTPRHQNFHIDVFMLTSIILFLMVQEQKNVQDRRACEDA